MNKKDIERLKFRRQYLLVPQNINCPFLCKKLEITDKYILYAHIDLVVTVHSESHIKLVLVGDIFDSNDTHKNNHDILKDLIDPVFEVILEKLSLYAGRFILIFINNNKISVLHDATAARKIYYCNWENNLWISSQPHLLASILNLDKTRDISKLEYYHSEDFVRLLNSNVGNTTYYDEIFQLLPNHFLSIGNFQIERYWPNKKIEILPIKDAVERCSKLIKGFMESIALRYEIMLPLTAGKDSRTLLAASYNFRDKVYYYINKEERLKMNSPDIHIPNKLLSKLMLHFNIVETNMQVDQDFQKVYFQNNPFGSLLFLPIIYNYYANFSEKVNLPGNMGSAGQEYYFNILTRKIKQKDLSELSELGKYAFADKYFKKWFTDVNALCNSHNINLLSLFYWENRLTNCILQVQLDKDIAQEEINPFNSHQLISYYLSVDSKYILPPDYIFHKRVIKHLWPEVLSIPINPSFRNYLQKIFKRLGLLEALYSAKYFLLHLKYR